MEKSPISFKGLHAIYEYRHTSGEAITKNGVPLKCAKHNIALALDTPFPGGASFLLCPMGDTVYMVVKKAT